MLDEVGAPSSTSKVVGHQWYWSYEQSDFSPCTSDSYICTGPLRLLSASSSLDVPLFLVLRFLITSSDVLHSWTVPASGMKADAVPGRLNMLSNYLDRPGTFYGQCSEICGSNHSFIPIKLRVLP